MRHVPLSHDLMIPLTRTSYPHQSWFDLSKAMLLLYSKMVTHSHQLPYTPQPGDVRDHPDFFVLF